MELNKKTYLQRHLEQLSTMELEELLQTEIRKEDPEEALVRILLQILEERDQQNSRMLPVAGEEAWEKYKKERALNKTEKKKNRRSMAQIAAMLAIVFTVVAFALPQIAKADSWLELITRWSVGFFEIFNSPNDKHEEHIFETDSAGLQKIYDAVDEMGITVPVVPMWMDDYELVEMKKTITPAKEKIHAILQSGNKYVTLTIAVYSTETSREMYKDEGEPEKYEICGITHYILHNNNMRTAIWTRENIACTLSVDCQEENFYKILKSIYTTEEN